MTIIGIKTPVLDQGFVRVVDVMGDDAAIVQAARISYGVGTKQVSEDEQLIRYLMRMDHATPFEMCEIKWHVRIPMDAWRQFVRHRTFSLNEYSTRYSEAIDATQQTDSVHWRMQASNNKQGSSGCLPEDKGMFLSAQEQALQQHAQQVYRQRLAAGVAREQARKDLPLSTYTEAYAKVDLRNMLHFLRLRMDPHAQLEIRLYANAMADILKQWVPMTWRAFEDYRLHAMQLSRLDVELIRRLLQGEAQTVEDACTQHGKRELAELKAKLVRLGVSDAE
jgi:thymidylate synthase (FAD)